MTELMIAEEIMDYGLTMTREDHSESGRFAS